MGLAEILKSLSFSKNNKLTIYSRDISHHIKIRQLEWTKISMHGLRINAIGVSYSGGNNLPSKRLIFCEWLILEKRQRRTEKALTQPCCILRSFTYPLKRESPQQMNFILVVKHCERPIMEPEYSDVKLWRKKSVFPPIPPL